MAGSLTVFKEEFRWSACKPTIVGMQADNDRVASRQWSVCNAIIYVY
ncbi:hypothetical protein [Bacteroides sp.]